MELFRYATSVYGENQLLGANWELIWWFGGAGLAYILADALCRPFFKGGKAPPPIVDAANDNGAQVTRHALADRLYHGAMALSVLTLLTTAFAPILDWKFEWVTPHWIAGVILTVLVLYHIIRASFWQDIWAMLPAPADFALAAAKARAAFGGGDGKPPKPGKYVLMQKAYHWAIAALVMTLIGTGLTMWLKVDTPFWSRNPYILADDTWGIVYASHDFCAMGVMAIVMIHIYFAVRPDKWRLNKSMLTGSISRADYLKNHDTKRWTPGDY